MSISPKSKALFKERANALKSAGISNFDLRRNPTEYEKRKARELYNKYQNILQYPEQYTVKVVSNKTAKAIDAKSGARKTKGGKTKIWLFNEGGKEITINRDQSFTVGKEGKDKFVRRVYPGGKDIFKTAEKLINKFNEKNLPPDDGEIDEKEVFFKEYLMVNIGDSADFSKSTAFTPEQFNNYINNWSPKDAEKLPEEKQEELRKHLIARMNVVKIYNPNGYFGEQPPNVKKKKARRKNRRH